MIFQEHRQSSTSPLKYIVELTPRELEKVKDLVVNGRVDVYIDVEV